MVFKMTLKDLQNSCVKYNDFHFGNPPLKIGNVVWVKVFDENGIFEMPVKIMKNKGEK